MADAVHREIGPDQLLWMPARHAPHKLDLQPENADDRLSLLRAAVKDRKLEKVCDWEIRRPSPSFTIHTLRQLHEHDPKDRFDLILGLDSLEHLASWHRFEEILKLAGFLFLPRKGWSHQDVENFHANLASNLRDQFRAKVIFMPLVPISSSQIREKLASGQPCDEMLPSEVLAEIKRCGLYQSG